MVHRWRCRSSLVCKRERLRGRRLQVADWEREIGAITLFVAERGILVISGPSDRDWGMRTVTFADPSGHVWKIAQPAAAA
jgi:uncharacterized glyoxalase superfamily protein PhnB